MSRPRRQRVSDVVKALIADKCMDPDSVLENPLALDYLIRNRMSVLHLACHMKNVQLVTAVLEQGEDVNIRGGDGTYPIHVLCSNVGHVLLNLKILEIFIKYNANLDVQDSEGRTPLMLACCNNIVSVVKTLTAAGCNVNIRDQEGSTAFSLSCHFASQGWYFWNADCFNDESGCLEENNFPCYRICQALLKAGADARQATLLPSAILYGSEEIVKEFIDHGMNVNAMDENRRTPLGCACSSYCVPLSTVKLLVEHGAYINEDVSRKSTPLILSVLNNSVDKMKFLLSHGATLNAEEMSELVSLSLTRSVLEKPEDINENIDELLSWKLLIKAGFRPKHDIYKLKLKEMNLRSLYPKEGKPIDDLIFPMNSLSDSCRISIRSRMSPCIDEKVEQLPLPNRLKRFLKFEEFSSQEDQC